MTDALSQVTDYEYDDFNRLKKIIYPPAFPGATGYRTHSIRRSR